MSGITLQGCFLPGVTRALEAFAAADRVSLKMEIDPRDSRYEVVVVEAMKPSGATATRRVKEKRDARPALRASSGGS